MRWLALALVAACAAANPPRTERGVAAVGATAGSTPEWECGSIEGFVVNASTGAPLPHVSVAIDRTLVYTDARGAWTLKCLLPGPYTLEVLALDGLTELDVTIDAGRTTRFDVRLDQDRMRALERAAAPVQTTKAECTPSAIERRLGATSDDLVDCGLSTMFKTDAVYARARDCIANAIAAHHPFRFADDSYGFGLVSLRGDGELRSYEISVFDGGDIGDRTIHGSIRQCRPLVARPYPAQDCPDFEAQCVTCEAIRQLPGCVVPP